MPFHHDARQKFNRATSILLTVLRALTSPEALPGLSQPLPPPQEVCQIQLFWSRLRLHADRVNARAMTAEVSLVEGQQPPLAMRQHGGHDVGVMDLAPRHVNGASHGRQNVRHLRPIRQDFDAGRYSRNVSQSFGYRERRKPVLREGDRSQGRRRLLPAIGTDPGGEAVGSLPAAALPLVGARPLRVAARLAGGPEPRGPGPPCDTALLGARRAHAEFGRLRLLPALQAQALGAALGGAPVLALQIAHAPGFKVMAGHGILLAGAGIRTRDASVGAGPAGCPRRTPLFASACGRRAGPWRCRPVLDAALGAQTGADDDLGARRDGTSGRPPATRSCAGPCAGPSPGSRRRASDGCRRRPWPCRAP